MAENVAIFRESTGRRIIQATRDVEQLPPRGASHRGRYPAPVGGTRWHAYTLGTLTAPVPPARTTCAVAVYRVKDGALDYIGSTVTAGTFDDSLELPEGAYVRIERLAGLWEFYWAGCGSQRKHLLTESGAPLLTESGQPLIQ